MRRLVASLVTTVATATALLVPTSASAVIDGTTAVTNPGSVSLWTLGPEAPHRNRCGGALIKDPTSSTSTEWVVTAAHCWDGVLAGNDPEVRIGSVDNTSGYTPRGVADVFIRPGYDPNTFANDTMLIKLDSPVSDSVQKPMLIGGSQPLPGSIGHIMGWGWPCETVGVPGCRVSVSGPGKVARIDVVDDSQCVNGFDWNTAHYFCVKYGTGIGCFGDSGSPFYTKQFSDYVWRGTFEGDGDDPTGSSCATAPDGNLPRAMVTDGQPARQWMIDTMSAN